VTHGMSAKAIGATLGLSVRTIEHNILVLKKKMGCKKKCDLIGKIIIDGMHGAVIAGGRE
jgi:DNA-binding NarL/FixJ family response regulator